MLPTFKYHPDPMKTGAFKQGATSKCNCCDKETDIWYQNPFYTEYDSVNCICPECI